MWVDITLYAFVYTSIVFVFPKVPFFSQRGEIIVIVVKIDNDIVNFSTALAKIA